jgi:hypothetical protein
MEPFLNSFTNFSLVRLPANIYSIGFRTGVSQGAWFEELKIFFGLREYIFQK